MKYRFATEEDAPLIMDFIRSLAEYENRPEAVLSDTELIRESLFSRKLAEVIFSLDELGQETGFALFYPTLSTFSGKQGLYLEDLFVYPAQRGKGYGKGLMQALAAIAAQRGYGKFHWSCLNWNEPSKQFYLSLGARPVSERTDYCVEGDNLRNLADSKDCPQEFVQA